MRPELLSAPPLPAAWQRDMRTSKFGNPVRLYAGVNRRLFGEAYSRERVLRMAAPCPQRCPSFPPSLEPRFPRWEGGEWLQAAPPPPVPLHPALGTFRAAFISAAANSFQGRCSCGGREGERSSQRSAPWRGSGTPSPPSGGSCDLQGSGSSSLPTPSSFQQSSSEGVPAAPHPQRVTCRSEREGESCHYRARLHSGRCQG